jgi:Spy/CpxP family protein refolding chaperone
MSDDPTQTSPQPPAAAPTKRHPWRSVFFGTALLLTGGIIGGLVASPGISQGWRGDGPGWQRAGNDGPRGERHEWRRGDREGHGRHWHRGHDGDGRRAWHRGGHHGFAGLLSPGRIERMVDRVLGGVDASTEQKQKVRVIAEHAADDLFALRKKHREGRKEIAQALTAETIDRAKIESLRADHVKLADETSKRITEAVTDAAEVLTPAQRAELGKRMERRGHRFRG